MKAIQAVTTILAVATLFTIPLLLDNYFVTWLFTLAAIYSIFTISWGFLERYSGRPSLGHASALGIPAYLAAISYNLGFGILTPALVSLLVIFLLYYLLSLKLGKKEFIFATFVISILLWVAAPRLVLGYGDTMVGGEEGFFLPHVPLKTIYLLSFLTLFITAMIYDFLARTGLGIKMGAVRDDELAAKALGVKISRMKFFASLLSTLTAVAAGYLYSFQFSHVSPEIFSVELSVFPLIVSIGGLSAPRMTFLSFALLFAARALNALAPQFHLVFYAALLILFPIFGRRLYAQG
jgi:branched-chain amino acid transport system permease protein